MSINKSEKRVLIITCSHWLPLNKFREELLKKNCDVEKVLFLGKEDDHCKDDKDEELLNNMYDIIIVQWHRDLRKKPDCTKLLPKMENTLKNTLNNGGTIVHLFESTDKETAEKINPILQETSPALYYITKSCYIFNKEQGYNFEIDSDSDINTASLVDSLNEEIRGFSTLNEVDKQVKKHITCEQYPQYPILLTKQIDKGYSIALAFSFCGGWNKKRAGLSEFLTLLFEQIIEVQNDTTKLKLEKVISKEKNELSTTQKPEEESIEIIETEKEQSIKSSVGHEEELEETDLLSDVGNDIEALEVEEGHGVEGNIKYYYGKRYERDSKNRELAINKHGLDCFACGFNFKKMYGERGKNFIEVHHIKPLSTLEQAVEVNPETDLVPLCANCHRMVHRRKDDVLSVEELKELIEQHR